MSKYWIFLVCIASLLVATIGCGSHGSATTTPSPTPLPSPTPTPPPPPTPTPAATPTTVSVKSAFNGNSPFISLQSPGATTASLFGTGFKSTDTQPVTPSTPLTTRVLVSANQWDLGLGFDDNHFRPGFYRIGDCDGSNCSNPTAPFAFLGDGLSRLSMGLDGKFCQRDVATVACFNANRSAFGSSFAVGNGAAGIAFDSAKSLVAVAGSSLGPVGLFDVTNPTAAGHFGPANVTGSVKDVAQLDDFGCVAQPNEGKVTIFPMDLTASSSVSSPAGAVGVKPVSVAMARVGTLLTCLSISTGSNQLTWISTIDGSTVGTPLVLAGLTTNGTPRVVTANSGAQTGKAAVIFPADNTVVFVDSNTKAEIRRVVITPSLTSHLSQITFDEVGGNLILIFANVNGSVASSSFAKLAIASGSPVPYTGPNSTSSLLFMDVAVSPSSPNIIGGSLGQNGQIPTQ
jgi:hypothetical protein